MLDVPGKISRCQAICTRLPAVGRRVLVGADQPAALQNKDHLANRAVEYVLAFPGEARSGQIRVEADDQYGGGDHADHAAGHHRIRRSWRVNCECGIGLGNRVALWCLHARDLQCSAPMKRLQHLL